MTFPIQYHHYLILITLLAGLICKKKNPDSMVVTLLCCLLAYNLLSEIIANIKWYVFKSSNLVIYNIAILVNYGIWFLVVRLMYTQYLRKWINISIVLFTIFFFVNLTLIQGTERFNSYSFLLGDIIVTFFSLKLFYNNIIDQEKNDPGEFNTIVIIGGLCYFTGFSVVFFTNEWGATKIEIFSDTTAHQLIAYLINTIFHGLLIFAFIRKIYKR